MKPKKLSRRKALKIFGALLVCLAGRPVRAGDKKGDIIDTFKHPVNYTFSEEGIGNIIIELKSGEDLIVPFSDIVEALKS